MALVQLELLHRIEKATGKKITELFQWIVASGIGGLLMLVMVYGMSQCQHHIRLIECHFFFFVYRAEEHRAASSLLFQAP